MKHRLPTVTLLGVPIVHATQTEALAEILRLAESGEPTMLAFANAHTLELSARDEELRRALQDSAMVLNDGLGISLAAMMSQRGAFPENLNGTDLSPKLLKIAVEKRWRLFLLGAAPGVAEKAAKIFIAHFPGIQIAGTHCGFFEDHEAELIARTIREAGTDVLLAGMGNPKQEKFLARHLAQTRVKLGAGVGAFLDFSAGVFPRAPAWMQRLRIEWLFRLTLEPKRLWRRYLLGGPVFLGRVAWDKVRNR
jgi:exopolysaccharide biosynthesis WecB/TagA/CpsF family protein